jgi:hypothetical protein
LIFESVSGGRRLGREAAELVVVGLVEDVRAQHLVAIGLADGDRALDGLEVIRVRRTCLDDLAVIEE